jgi:hypothetical protein
MQLANLDYVTLRRLRAYDISLISLPKHNMYTRKMCSQDRTFGWYG